MPIDAARRTDRGALVALLESRGVEMGRGGRTFRCPFHDDKSPSASLYERTGGVWAFHCFVCAIDEDVYGMEDRFGIPRQSLKTHYSPATALSEAKTTPVSGNGHKIDSMAASVVRAAQVFQTLDAAVGCLPHVVKSFPYTHPDTGQVDYCAVRRQPPGERKQYSQIVPCEGGYKFGSLEVTPLYNRKRVREAALVLLVEGEGKVQALAALKIVGACWPGGAAAVGKCDFSTLAGKTVVLWPDNDPPDAKSGKRAGIEAMRAAVKRLKELEPACSLYWIDPDPLGLPEKGDVVDYLAALDAAQPDATREAKLLAQRRAIELLIDEAYPIEDEFQDYHLHQIAVLSGKWSAVEWPFWELGRSTKALYPETQTMLCGEGGTSKSLLIRQAVSYWLEQGIPIADFELEDNKTFHIKRAHAQLAQESGIVNDQWMRSHKDEYAELEKQYKPQLSVLSKVIDAAPNKAPTIGDMLAWAIKKAKAGKRLIIIDPITACIQGDKSWNDDLSFILESRDALRTYGASLIVVTHPKKLPRGSVPSLADLSGGQAWPRFSQTVLWIASMAEAQDLTCNTQHGTAKARCNRVVKILKARNSWGTGCEIGLYFHGKSLLFEEHGVINKEKGNKRGR